MGNVLRIVLIQGPDETGVPAEHAFEADAQIGRSIESEMCLPAPTVSRRHATLRLRQGLWYIADEGSTSGTVLNGNRLDAGVPAELRGSDTLEIGPWSFRVKDAGTVTQTIAIAKEETGVIEVPITSRRLDALGGYLAALERADSAKDLASATVDAALAGTGFRRGAVLYPPAGEGDPPEYFVGRSGVMPGSFDDLDPGGFQPSGRLIARALGGRTAMYSAPDAESTIDHSQSLVADSIAAALCVPIVRDGAVEALLYLDSRGNAGGVRDAGGYCEDIARLYSFALTSRANADFAQRQHAMRIEFEHAKELRAMLSTPEVLPGGVFRCAHRSIAGMFVSADFFDTVPHADGSMHAVFGDATGHGLGASMLSTLIHAHLVALLGSGIETVSAVSATNRFVSEKATAGRFVSLVVLHLRPDGRLTIVDAGHGHWAHAHAGGLHTPAGAASVPIGVDPDASFGVERRTIAPGDRVVLYTDGITEQEDSKGEQLGVRMLRDVIGSCASCDDDVARVHEALMRHADGRLIEDDATIASIEMRPAEG